MFITRECDYAVRVIRALAGEERLSVSEICEKEDITAPFAYKILKKLQKAKIVCGYRGVHGGYSLDKKLEDITLLAIYQAIDPNMLIVECLDPAYSCSRHHAKGGMCRVHLELNRIQERLWEMLSEKSLKEILEGQKSEPTEN